MNIAHIRDVYLRVTFIHHYLTHFRRHNHVFLCREIKDRDIFPYPSIRKTSIFYLPLYLLNKVWTVKLNGNKSIINDWWSYYGSIKKMGGASILHAHMGPQGFYAVPLSRKSGIPLVVTFYGADMSNVVKRPGWMKNYKELFEAAALIFVEGPFMRARMIELGCPVEKVKVSRLAIPIRNIKFELRPPYGKNQILRVLMCATFVPKKGHLDAIEAMGILKKGGLDFHCDIIGDGPLKGDVTGKIRELGLEGCITLHGKVKPSEIFGFASRAHVFFHPSKTAPDGDTEGGAPTVCLEMQAAGLPIVATTHADIPNIIPSENHYLAPEGDIQGLAQQFQRMLDAKDEWNLISQRGRSFVEANHDGFACSAKIEEYYDSIVK